LGSGHNDAPQNNARVTSSESSMGNEWFEDWPEANDMVASVYVTLTMQLSLSREDHERPSHRPWSCPRAHAPKIASAFDNWQPARRTTAGRKPCDPSSAGRESRGRKRSPSKPHSRKSSVSGSQSRQSAEAKKVMAGGDPGARRRIFFPTSLLLTFDQFASVGMGGYVLPIC
jgi:hypothetical protein